MVAESGFEDQSSNDSGLRLKEEVGQKKEANERYVVLNAFAIVAFILVHLAFVVLAGLLCRDGTGFRCVITTFLTPVFSWGYWTGLAYPDVSGGKVEDIKLFVHLLRLIFIVLGSICAVLLLRYGSRERMGILYIVMRWMFALVLPPLLCDALGLISHCVDGFTMTFIVDGGDLAQHSSVHPLSKMYALLVYLGPYPLCYALLMRAVYEIIPMWKRALSAIWGCVFLFCVWYFASFPSESPMVFFVAVVGCLSKLVGLGLGVYCVIRYGETSFAVMRSWAKDVMESFDLTGRIKRARPAIRQLLENGLAVVPGKNYLMARTVVTQEQWMAVKGDGKARFPGPNHPMETISWKDCMDFLKDLNAHPDVKEAKLEFRLPSEEEWEYACRAGATGDLGLLRDGKEGSSEMMGWYDENSENHTHPVAMKEPNAWGLYDMHGNVWEWTSTMRGSDIICCGGAWDSGAKACAAGSRRAIPKKNRQENIGFRLIAVPRR